MHGHVFSLYTVVHTGFKFGGGGKRLSGYVHMYNPYSIFTMHIIKSTIWGGGGGGGGGSG